MKIYPALAKIRIKQQLSPATMNMLITDASILLLLLITVFRLLS